MPTFTWVKVKVEFSERLYEQEGETAWCSAKEKLPLSYEVIGDLVCRIIKKEIEISLRYGVPDLISISWSIFNGPTNKYMKAGRYTEFKEGDPPIAFMTPLPIEVNEMIEQYHQARRASKKG